ncbi:hypothetical protein [Marinagarivorans algicola]|uniref:hypothetical protein n=1 Tax=Marinagarivorans algicola TaxID=1513270 RepID=UPI0006B9E937|nr:hypothetical protein [Marinagarivorans algicola]
MRKKHGPSLYHMSDKNIFDAMQHKKVTINSMHTALLDRGILLSNEADKMDVAEYLASVPHDYHDYQYISSLLESVDRKEPSTLTTLEASVSKANITDVCQKITKALKDKDEVLKVSQRGDKTILTATYTEIDYTKTELRQRSTKTATLEVENHDGELVIRRPANKKAEEIEGELKSLLSNSLNQVIKQKTISLESFAQPEARSYFFERLIQSIDGYSLFDVKHVDVKYAHTLGEHDDEEDEDEDALLGHIQKAILNGEGVLQSKEFSQLHSSGFYITKITWQSVPDEMTLDKAEFFASFGNPESCTDFRYMVRYLYANKEVDTYNKTGKAPTAMEKRNLTRLLEKAAARAYDAVVAKFGVLETSENNEEDEMA